MKRNFDEAIKDIASSSNMIKLSHSGMLSHSRTIKLSHIKKALASNQFGVSKAIKEGDLEKDLKVDDFDFEDAPFTCLSLLKIVELNSSLNSDQTAAVKSMGFGGLLELKCTILRRSLCKWIIDAFDPLSNTWEAAGCKIHVTAIDVEQILGLSSQGLPVPVQGSDEDIADLCKQFEEFDSLISLTTVGDKIRGCTSSGKDFQMMYCIFVIGHFMSPMTDFTVKKGVLHAVKNVDTISSYNWAQYMLDEFLHGVQRAKRLKHEYLNGCMLFLMILFFERVGHFVHILPERIRHLNQNLLLQGHEPHMKFWTNKAVERFSGVKVLENGTLCFGLSDEEIDFLHLWNVSDCLVKIMRGKDSDNSPRAQAIQNFAAESDRFFRRCARDICSDLVIPLEDLEKVVIKASNCRITKNDVVKFFKENLLSKSIIDTLAKQMHLDSQNFSPTKRRMYSPALSATFSDVEMCVQRQRQGENATISIISVVEFYIPLHYDGHEWLLVILNFDTRQVMICDPTHGMRTNHEELNCRVRHLLGLLEELLKDKDGNSLKLTSFPFVHPDWVPQLIHPIYAGMVVCTMLMQAGRDAPDFSKPFSISNKYNLIARLWLHSSNEARVPSQGASCSYPS